MSAATDYTELEWMKYMFTATAMGTRPTAWYAALHTADPTDVGNVGEVTTTLDAAYARKAVTLAQTANEVKNSAALTFNAVDAASAGYTVSHITIWDALTAGNCLFRGALAVPKALAAGEVLSFAINELVLSVN